MKQIKIDVSEMGDVKIENKDGFITITPVVEEKPVESKKWPKVGYFTYTDATVREYTTLHNHNWDDDINRNVYPYRQHAELFGQVLAPLLVKHYVLTGGYWEGKSKYAVMYNTSDHHLGFCNFPFPNRELAEKFLEENREQLNKITELWQLK